MSNDHVRAAGTTHPRMIAGGHLIDAGGRDRGMDTGRGGGGSEHWYQPAAISGAGTRNGVSGMSLILIRSSRRRHLLTTRCQMQTLCRRTRAVQTTPEPRFLTDKASWRELAMEQGAVPDVSWRRRSPHARRPRGWSTCHAPRASDTRAATSRYDEGAA